MDSFGLIVINAESRGLSHFLVRNVDFALVAVLGV